MNREYYKTNYFQQSNKCSDYENSILHNINYSALKLHFKTSIDLPKKSIFLIFLQ
jgi:hypothetical protein